MIKRIGDAIQRAAGSPLAPLVGAALVVAGVGLVTRYLQATSAHLHIDAAQAAVLGHQLVAQVDLARRTRDELAAIHAETAAYPGRDDLDPLHAGEQP